MHVELTFTLGNIMYMSFTYHLYRSYGVLVWEVATYGEPPHEGIKVSELIELASNGSLKLNR